MAQKKPKMPTQSTVKSAKMSQDGGINSLQAPKPVPSQFSAIENANISENGPCMQQTSSTSQFTSTDTQSISTFSVSGPLDVTLECTGSLQPASLNPYLSHGKIGSINRVLLDKAKATQDRTECQKRKLEVNFVFMLLG